MRYCIDEAAAVAGTAATTRELDEGKEAAATEEEERSEIARKIASSPSEAPVHGTERIFGSQRNENPQEATFRKGALLEDSPGGPILRGTIPFIGRQTRE